MFTATKVQVGTYLVVICLFSISLLVFLNASISFIVTSILHQRRGVGNAVGTLGFADELLAIFACPLWGYASDFIGVRVVSPPGCPDSSNLMVRGLCTGLCDSRNRSCALSECKECLSTALVCQTVVQSWSIRDLYNDYGHTSRSHSPYFTETAHR